MLADARVYLQHRGESGGEPGNLYLVAQALRLALVSDAFLAQAMYRLKARLQGLSVPILPRICHRLAIMLGQVAIGDPVLVRPGVYLAHGQVVIDGITEIGAGSVISPFVTVGLLTGNFQGPTVGPRVRIGTGARVLGPIEIGAEARIGANSVVLGDVPEGATAVGAPARIAERSESAKRG